MLSEPALTRLIGPDTTGMSLLKCSLQAVYLGQQVWGCQCGESSDAVNTQQRVKISVLFGLILTVSCQRTITEIIRIK